MADEAATQETSGADETSVDTTNTAAEESATDASGNEGEAALGDAGKKALDAMKAARNEARSQAAEFKAQLDALQAKVDGREAEYAASQEAQRVKDEALAAANQRILTAEVRGAAKGKLNDPADALIYIDLSSFEVGDDGSVDSAAVEAAIDDLISKKPYLAAQGGQRFQGSVDGGARKETTKSIDDQIAEATAAGKHGLAISLKRQKAYADQ